MHMAVRLAPCCFLHFSHSQTAVVCVDAFPHLQETLARVGQSLCRFDIEWAAYVLLPFAVAGGQHVLGRFSIVALRDIFLVMLIVP